MSGTRRLRWWSELPLIVMVYALYSLARLLVQGDVSSAVEHGLAILDVEKSLHLNAEHPLNALFTSETWLGVPADYIYASLHYLVTPAVLIWLWKRRAGHYRAMRTWLMLSTLIGLIGFTCYPTCPPRLLAAGHGFVDTMAQYGEYGWWGAEASAPQGLGGLTNQYAAMPSLHVGWALWCGVVLWRLGPCLGRAGVWTRASAVGYPLVIILVVMGTANHYFLDAVAGAAVMGLGLLLTRPALRAADTLRARLPVRRGFAVGGIVARGPAGDAVRDPAASPGTSANVGGGCQTSARTANPGEAREAKADEHIPQQRNHGSSGRATAESPAPTAR